MKTLTFYKEEERWYVDIPEYLEEGGNEDNLEMVLGTDDLLEELSNKGEEITLLLTVDSAEIREKEQIPAYTQHNWEYLIRADYIPTSSGKYYTGYNSRYIWLSPLWAWIFQMYPQYVYYKVVKNNQNEDS
jgi:hypothetical protein